MNEDKIMNNDPNLQRAKNNLGAMKFQPSEDPDKEIRTLVTVGHLLVESIQSLHYRLDELERKIEQERGQ